jgi:AcrR family transcriptional regulator
MFATREDLLAAVALDAIEHLAGLYERVGIPGAFEAGSRPDESWAAFVRLAEDLVPLGPRLTFLLRASELDGESALSGEVEALDAIFEAAIRRAQDRGTIRKDASANWLMESFYALTLLASEHVRDGKLASRDAAALVVDSWRNGVAAG